MENTVKLSNEFEKQGTKKITKNLYLKPVELTAGYCKVWNVLSNTEFYHLYNDGLKISDTLYRVGGLGRTIKDGYFMLLKQVESRYKNNVTPVKADKLHLADTWCILNEEGEEKVIFEKFDSPYLMGGQVYKLNNRFFNIETKELYCETYQSISSESHIFLEQGNKVRMVHKITGAVKIFD